MFCECGNDTDKQCRCGVPICDDCEYEAYKDSLRSQKSDRENR